MGGEPLQVVIEEADGSFTLNKDNLKRILLHKDVRNRKVSVVSIAGAFRKGKSLQLNFMLRYLSQGRSEDWLADPNARLGGFPWRCGSDLETRGIVMWSKPYLIDDKAVLLMDTQGLFDSSSTTAQTSTIFALSTLLSSVQIFNLSMNIQENDLQTLHYFTAYGRLVVEASEGEFKPFQKLTVLVRDWPYEFEHEYGKDGGRRFLAKRLNANEEGQPEELVAVRQHIQSCFETVECFLMPEPDKLVRTSPHFDGSLNHIDQTFLHYQNLFVRDLFHDIQVKTIAGRDLTGSDLLQYFSAYMEVFRGGALPEPMSAVQATARAGQERAVNDALTAYRNDMHAICQHEKRYTDPELDKFHQQAVEAALVLFDGILKLGGAEMNADFRQLLKRLLRLNYDNFLALYHQLIDKGNKETMDKVMAWVAAGAGIIASVGIIVGSIKR